MDDSIERIDEIWLGTISCSVMYQDGCNTLVAVYNEEPDNGAFSNLMDFLEDEARQLKRALRVEPIWNNRLKQHLIRTRNYRDYGEGVIRDVSVK